MANFTGSSIVDYLKSVGKPSDINSRIALGKQYGIDYSKSTTNYAAENTQLLGILNKPTPQATPTTQPQYIQSPTNPNASIANPNYIAPTQPQITPTTPIEQTPTSYKYTYTNKSGITRTDIRGSEQEARDFVASVKGTFIGQVAPTPTPPQNATQTGQGGTQVPQSMVDTMGQVNQMIGNISQGVQELGGQGVITPQTPQTPATGSAPAPIPPIISNIGKEAIETSGSVTQAEKQKKLDEAKAILEKANAQSSTIQDLTNQTTIQTLQAGLVKPAEQNFTSTYEALRSEKGVSALETQMNKLKADKLALQDSLQMGLNKVSNKLEPMELIGSEQQEIQNQANEKINTINRELTMVQDEYNTKINIVSNLMQLKQTDYTNSVNAYNTAFSQAIQIQQLLTTQENKQQTIENQQVDNAKANISLILNTLQDSGTSWDTMDTSLQTELKSLGLKAGFSANEIQVMFNSLDEGEKQISSTLVESASGDYYSILTQKADGTYATSTMLTGKSTPVKGTAGEVADEKDKTENTRILNELTDSGKRNYVSKGYYDQVKANQTLYSGNAFDDKFSYLLSAEDQKKLKLQMSSSTTATDNEWTPEQKQSFLKMGVSQDLLDTAIQAGMSPSDLLK